MIYNFSSEYSKQFHISMGIPKIKYLILLENSIVDRGDSVSLN